MEVKKTEGASLENKRLLFIELGLIFALAVTFGAFSWSTKEKQLGFSLVCLTRRIGVKIGF